MQSRKEQLQNRVYYEMSNDVNSIRLGIFGYSNIQIIETLMQKVVETSPIFTPFIRSAVWTDVTYIKSKYVSFAEDGELCLDTLNYKEFTKDDIIQIFNDIFKPEKYKESFDADHPRPYDISWCIIRFQQLLCTRSGKPLDPFMQQSMKTLIEEVKKAEKLWHMGEINMIFKNGVMNTEVDTDYVDLDAIGNTLKEKYEEILKIEKLCDD